MKKYVIVNNDYLQHHGILGMHWGIRRFQPYPSGSKNKGKEVGAAKKVKQREPSYREKRMMKKEKKKQEKEFTNLRKEQQQQYDSVRKNPKVEQMVKTAEQRRKEKAIASGNLDQILKNRGSMSNEELQQAIERTRLINQLKDLSATEKQKAKRSFDKTVNNSKKDKNNKKKENLGDRTFNQIDKASKRLGTTLKLINTVIALGTVMTKLNRGSKNTKTKETKEIEKTMDEVLKNLDVTLDDYYKKK